MATRITSKKQVYYGIYSLLSRLPFPFSYPGKIILVTFLGIHVPLLLSLSYLSTYCPFNFDTTVWTFGITLFAILIGTAFTFYVLSSLLSPISLISSTLREYVNGNKVPDLPTHFTDEVGRLMSDVQYAVRHIDGFIRSLEKISMTDYLTGVYNRCSGESRLKEDIARARRSGSKISLAMLDIDDFKLINDKYGHDVGDLCLKHIVKVMEVNIRKGDWLVRWGGDEFVLILFNSDKRSAEITVERICLAVQEQPIHTSQGEINLMLSAGICQYNGRDDAQELFKKADSALLLAKRLGKSQVVNYTDSAPLLNQDFRAIR
ncbi:MAG TPA: GGDEF domain-containing protein [Thermodesulfobacteriota bacterium]|nr:GGDEF domain-containing protein [Thermodesulfobacteriota bacterium]